MNIEEIREWAKSDKRVEDSAALGIAEELHIIDFLLAEVEQLTKERDEAKKENGYTCHVCGALRKECEIMKRASDDTAIRCAEIANEMPRCTGTSIAAAIRAEFGIEEGE